MATKPVAFDTGFGFLFTNIFLMTTDRMMIIADRSVQVLDCKFYFNVRYCNTLKECTFLKNSNRSHKECSTKLPLVNLCNCEHLFIKKVEIT